VTAGQQVDHINQDPLDNRRANLRICTKAQNRLNIAQPEGQNPHRGVTILKSGMFRSRIGVDWKSIDLGVYEKLEDAVAARVRAEKEYFGEFAPQRINLRSA
jgi:hypothetical protein